MTLLFVYGTLKRGQGNAGRMRGATFVRSALTGEGYGLRRLGDYPVLTQAAGGRVEGELFLVPGALLVELDAFEGCPDLYRREEIQLQGGGRAQAYVMSGSRLAGTPWIASGCWPTPG